MVQNEILVHNSFVIENGIIAWSENCYKLVQIHWVLPWSAFKDIFKLKIFKNINVILVHSVQEMRMHQMPNRYDWRWQHTQMTISRKSIADILWNIDTLTFVPCISKAIIHHIMHIENFGYVYLTHGNYIGLATPNRSGNFHMQTMN